MVQLKTMALDKLIEERLKKLENFKEAGIDPYPAQSKRTHLTSEALADFSKLSKSKKKVFINGRIVGLRVQGGLMFIDLQDQSGNIQLLVRKNQWKKHFNLFKNNLDIGDFLEAQGPLFKTKKGQKSVDVKNLRLLVKSLRPLPDQWYGLEDVEIKLRQRYLDLLINHEVKELFVKKSKFWNATRSFLTENSFLEVETPVLEAIPGGADAEPFVTHHNALGADFYLRISLELPLKKILVGGYESVFEIGRIFRNEGISPEHLQDYTQCEFYWAYHDINDLKKFSEKLYKKIVKETTGGLKTKWQGKDINWGGKWPELDYYKLFKKKVGLDIDKATLTELRKKVRQHKIKLEKGLGKGRLVDLLYKKLIRPSLIQPAFLMNPPALLEPLAKRSMSNPNRVERLQIVACGTELGKGFSEGNDPVDQRARFEEQMALREGGDKEAQRLDEDFLNALEYGMPPAAGFGFSERLFAILMDRPVRETVIFPLMKQKK